MSTLVENCHMKITLFESRSLVTFDSHGCWKIFCLWWNVVFSKTTNFDGDIKVKTWGKESWYYFRENCSCLQSYLGILKWNLQVKMLCCLFLSKSVVVCIIKTTKKQVKIKEFYFKTNIKILNETNFNIAAVSQFNSFVMWKSCHHACFFAALWKYLRKNLV